MRWSNLAVFGAIVALTQPAAGQAPPPEAPPPPETPAPPPPPLEAQPDQLAAALRPAQGGLTLDAAARRAVATSPAVAVARAELEAAAAQVDEAFVRYFPTVTLGAGYTRLSEVENELEIAAVPGGAGVEFPVIVDQLSLSAQLLVPVSDYLLRLRQSHAGASAAAEAAEIDTHAKELETASSAEVAVLEWVRAHGRTAVAALAIEQSAAHVRDARTAIGVGVVSEADVLRLEAQLAEAEHLHRAAQAFEKVAEQQVRSLLHVPAGEALSIGVDVLSEPPGEVRQVATLQELAIAQRPELRALGASERSLEAADDLAWAGYFPRIDGTASLLYANPNPRIFPQEDAWDLTWDAGVRLTWVVNETFVAPSRTRATGARIAAVREQAQQLRDAIVVAVTRAYYDGVRARSAVVAAERREVALKKALDARLEVLRVGRATSTDVIDAETELTRARLQRIDAHIDALAARIQLDYALGAGATP